VSKNLFLQKVLTKNGVILKSPTLNTIDAVEILKQVFGLTTKVVFGVATNKSPGRGIGFTFKLKQNIKIIPSKLQEFSFIIGESKFTGRLLTNVGIAPSLGELVQVSVVRTNFALTEDQIALWLSAYGQVASSLQYRENPEISDVVEDNIDLLMRLKKHIPSVLPAYGKKLNIRYKGQPILCSKCLIAGHVRKTCTSTANNWMGYVKMFVDSGLFHHSMFGVWYEYLKEQESTQNPPTQ